MDFDRLDCPVLAERPYAMCNMVMTVDGKATIVGTADGLLDQADRQALQRCVSMPTRPAAASAPLLAQELLLRSEFGQPVIDGQ